jgi:hypothetical protein
VGRELRDAGDPVNPDSVQPGDVLLTRNDAWAGRLIRFGAALRELTTGKPNPNLRNHVVVVTHRDLLGVLWGIEATADGVTDADLSHRLLSAWVLGNPDQPKTPTQRASVVKVVQAMRGTAYDWDAILGDGVRALGIDRLWRPLDWEGPGGRLPKAVVCSALADYAYQQAGLPSPGGNTGGRFTTPADWDAFITTRGWEHP